MRKTLLLLAALFMVATTTFAQHTPYEYHKRWYFSAQMGPSYFVGDYTFVYHKEKRTLEPLVPAAGLALGYNMTDADELRFLFMYNKNRSTCVSLVDALYPHTFRSVSFYADFVRSFNALGEYFTSFNPKMYVGLGCAYTFDFTDPHHPERVLTDPNFVPGFNFGGILEYDFRSGLGVYLDLGLMYTLDPGDGQGWVSFPLDMDVALSVGLVYHFQRSKNKR